MPFEKYINYKALLSHPLSYLALLLLCPLPFLMLAFQFFFNFQSLDSIGEEITRIEKKSHYSQEWHKKETAFLSMMKQADHFYIDKHLETLSFLEPELKKMETLLLDSAPDDHLKKRVQFLKEGSNRLLFSEEKIRQHQQFLEVEEYNQTPVEMNEEDLKKLLSLIEGVTIWPYGPKESRPQLILTDFQLTKKELPSHENVFVIDLKLLKRESALHAKE